MNPSRLAIEALKTRHVFPHALLMEDSMVTSPCNLLLVHPDEPAAGSGEQVFGFYLLDEDELQQAMQVCSGRVMGCSFLERGRQQCRLEVVEEGQARWFRYDGNKFKRLKNEDQKIDGDQLRPPRED